MPINDADDELANWILTADYNPRELRQALQAWSDQRTAAVLERLHRTSGPGLPKREFDNVTDEAIDGELEALSPNQEELP